MTLFNNLSKLFIALLLTVITNQAVFATIQPPDFSEFRSDFKMKYTEKHRAAFFLPKYEAYTSKQKEYDDWYNNYWQNRQSNFHASIEQCRILTTDHEQDHCYMALRVSEHLKTTDYIKHYYTDYLDWVATGGNTSFIQKYTDFKYGLAFSRGPSTKHYDPNYDSPISEKYSSKSYNGDLK